MATMRPLGVLSCNKVLWSVGALSFNNEAIYDSPGRAIHGHPDSNRVGVFLHCRRACSQTLLVHTGAILVLFRLISSKLTVATLQQPLTP